MEILDRDDEGPPPALAEVHLAERLERARLDHFRAQPGEALGKLLGSFQEMQEEGCGRRRVHADLT